MQLDAARIEDLVRRALAEDLGERGDLTTRVSVPEDRGGTARILARESGVLAGVDVARACFELLSDRVEVLRELPDGARLEPGAVVLELRGPAVALLAGERTALNLLQRMSGVATRARAFVDAVAGTGTRVLDTRKTTPGLRVLERYAVVVGGAENHRFGLFDRILLKENHFALAVEPRRQVVARAVASGRGPVIAEARDREEAREVVQGGADVVLLDNFGPGPELVAAVGVARAEAARLGRRIEIEASGGITLGNARAFAECGVDRISVGSLTHSVPALDLSMLVEGTAMR